MRVRLTHVHHAVYPGSAHPGDDLCIQVEMVERELSELAVRAPSLEAPVSSLSGVLFGCMPAWQAARANVNEILKDGGLRLCLARPTSVP